MREPLIPPVGSVPEPERMFRLNWVVNLRTTPSGVPFVSADFTAKQGRKVRVIDVREAEELTGALGHVPGSDWVPRGRVHALPERVGLDEPVILVSGGEERAHEATALLVKAGMRFVAFMVTASWRSAISAIRPRGTHPSSSAEINSGASPMAISPRPRR